jgi:hypothetical protein
VLVLIYKTVVASGHVLCCFKIIFMLLIICADTKMLLHCVCGMCETMAVFFLLFSYLHSLRFYFMFEVAYLPFGDATNHNPYNGLFVTYEGPKYMRGHKV